MSNAQQESDIHYSADSSYIPLPSAPPSPMMYYDVGGDNNKNYYGGSVMMMDGNNNNNNQMMAQQQEQQAAQLLYETVATLSTIPISSSTYERLRRPDMGYSKGMIESFQESKRAYPLRFVIVDNSGSMRANDGTKIILNHPPSSASKNCAQQPTFVPSTSRWTEMEQTVENQIRIAGLIQAPTIFRLLNDPGTNVGPQEFRIGCNSCSNTNSSMDAEVDLAIRIMQRTTPGGVTFLTSHMKEIQRTIRFMEPQLRRDGTKVAIIVATDGLPSNAEGISTNVELVEFEETLRSMERLPIWIVVRLFTNEPEIVDYWNKIDSNLELSIEVLDDYQNESKEIYETNPWLNYTISLHRLREFGCSNNIFDTIDENLLSKDQIRQYCRIILGTGTLFDEAPDPNVDWNKFCLLLEQCIRTEFLHYHSIKNKYQPLIDMTILNQMYHTKNTGGSSSSCCVIL